MGKELVAKMVVRAKLDSGFNAVFNTLDQKTKSVAEANQRLTGRARAYEQALTRLRSVQSSAGDANGKIATSMGVLSGKLGEVNRQLDRTSAKISRLQKLQQNRVRRSELGGELMGIAGAAVTVAAPVVAAVRFESTMADVRKVVDFETPDQFKAMSKDILDLSRHIPMAAEGIGDIVAAAGQAGIARTELTRFAQDAAKMGVAFDMNGTEAGSSMTGLRSIFHLGQDGVVSLGDAFNHLSNKMDATARDIVTVSNRAGSSAKMIGFTGQQVGALAATFLALKTPPEVAGTAMNALFSKLATANKQGAKFQQALADIGMSAEELKEAIATDAQGALLGFLEAVDASEDPMGVLSDLFGMEYADDMTKLVGGLDQYRKSLSLVAKESSYAGSMEKEYAERANTTANHLTLLKNKANVLGITVGNLLLPPMNTAVGVLGVVADAATWVAETFPRLTSVVMFGAGSLVALKVVGLAAGYAATVLSDGWLMGKAALELLRPSVLRANLLLLRQTVISLANSTILKAQAVQTLVVAGAQRAAVVAGKTWVAVQWALNAAMTANPIGLVVAGAVALGAAAWAVIEYWEPIKEFFAGLWESVVSSFTWAWDTIGSIMDKVSWWFGGGESSVPSAHPLQHEAIPQAQAVRPSTQQQQTHNEYGPLTIHIAADKGMDEETLARKVARIVNQRNTGVLHD